ncbi:Sec-independent protein translocase protein TatB [Psychrobacter pygoscelis]|uniref:Sec-independent protein translocase protein TatB n=1 Tax=Psychrobacter pygoscelis TaxID=2488563 RepID=UPI00103A2D36|nr:Sec-independent protein translocase protein TatB [Psychrobacter pygoscelis]
MFDIGFSELLLFGVIALVVLGPEKLPQAARTAGHWYAKFRRTVSTLQSEIEAELDLAETRQKMQEELAKIKQAEAEMKREMAELRGSMQEFENAQNQSLTTAHTSQATSGNLAKPSPVKGANTEAPLSSTSQKQDVNDNNDTTDATAQSPSATLLTKPWEHMWFRLGEYDKVRRLPAAPRLPNYHADALLYHSQTSQSSASQSNSNQASAAATLLPNSDSEIKL